MKTTNYCFKQSAENDICKLYIYDDVSEHGDWNWTTWNYEESETSAKYFRDQMNLVGNNQTIELHINSNGGSVKEGVAIYNLLKQKNCHKVGIVDGVAYSVAFVILQACDERIMQIGTTALVHEIWMEVAGNAKQLRKAADDLDVLMEANRKIFLERSNLDEQKLIEMMEAETFLTPDQCLEYGFIDKIDKQSIEKESEKLEQLQQVIVKQQKTIAALQNAGKKNPAEPQKLKNFLRRM